MTQPQIKGEPISASTFYMWRCIIAIAHADGRIQDAERAYLQKVFDNMDRVYGLTPEQKAAFADDLKYASPQKIPELLSHINEPAARADLIYFGNLLAHADGVLNPSEEEILKKLRADQMAGIDMQQIEAHAKKVMADEDFQESLANAAVHSEHGFLGIIDRFLLRHGVDLLG